MGKWDELAWTEAMAQAALGGRQSAADYMLAVQLEQAPPWAGQHHSVSAFCARQSPAQIQQALQTLPGWRRIYKGELRKKRLDSHFTFSSIVLNSRLLRRWLGNLSVLEIPLLQRSAIGASRLLKVLTLQKKSKR